MRTFEEIKTIIADHKGELRRRYGVAELGAFGSYVTGDQKAASDLDILVEFEKTPGLFSFMEMEEYLENLLGIKVDLVSKKALQPGIGQAILKELVVI